MTDTFDGGYTKALLDVQHFFESYSEALKYHKLYNIKGIKKVMDFLVANRQELKETGTIEDIIVTKDKKLLVRKGGGSNG